MTATVIHTTEEFTLSRDGQTVILVDHWEPRGDEYNRLVLTGLRAEAALRTLQFEISAGVDKNNALRNVWDDYR